MHSVAKCGKHFRNERRPGAASKIKAVAHNVAAKPVKLSLKLHLIPKTTFERQCDQRSDPV